MPSGANSNLTWLDRFIPTHFEDKKTIYIAVDEDSAGLKLRDELLRRLGTERCGIVHFGPAARTPMSIWLNMVRKVLAFA